MFSSIRSVSKRHVALAVISSSLLAAGCSRQQMMSKVGRFDPDPIDPVLKDPVPDAAATARNFEPSTLIYPNGQVVAQPVYYTTYETRPKILGDDVAYGVAAPLIFLGDVALAPLRLATQLPGTLVLYSGAQYGRSMTVAPPLPGNLPEGDKSEVPGNPALAPMPAAP